MQSCPFRYLNSVNALEGSSNDFRFWVWGFFLEGGRGGCEEAGEEVILCTKSKDKINANMIPCQTHA